MAIFTHCYAHVLNLVLQQSLSSIKECLIFFQSLNGLSAFFSRSSKRSHELRQFKSRKLPAVAPARRNFTSRISNTVLKHRNQLMDFFQYVVDNPEDWDSDTLIKSEGFLRFLSRFETIWLLKVFSRLFAYTDVLFNMLQSKMYVVLYCGKKVEDFLQHLQNERQHGFEELWATTAESESSTTGTAREREKRIVSVMKATLRVFILDYFVALLIIC